MENQALDDLGLDALDLADVISDQVRRLGPQSRTKKAISIFGYVGQQTQASQMTDRETLALKGNARRLPITQRSLTRMLLETSGSVAESAISSLLIWTFAFLQKLWKISSAHRILLAFLGISALANLMYTSRDTSEWWAERNAGNFMARIGVGPDLMMRKSIHLEDLDNLLGDDLLDAPSDSENQWYLVPSIGLRPQQEEERLTFIKLHDLPLLELSDRPAIVDGGRTRRGGRRESEEP